MASTDIDPASAPVELRKVCTVVEEIFHDGGPLVAPPRRRAAVIAVIRNPFAGRYVASIEPYMEALKPLGLQMANRLLAALGGDPAAVDAYGKGTIVGAAGEIEHGAFWHVPGGYAMREVLGGARAIVPSTTKMGTLGTRIDIPIHHKDAAYVRSHFDAMEVGVPDAPRQDELALVLVMACGGRVHARMGGLEVSQISKWDGQR